MKPEPGNILISLIRALLLPDFLHMFAVYKVFASRNFRVQLCNIWNVATFRKHLHRMFQIQRIILLTILQ